MIRSVGKVGFSISWVVEASYLPTSCGYGYFTVFLFRLIIFLLHHNSRPVAAKYGTPHYGRDSDGRPHARLKITILGPLVNFISYFLQ